jgi:archaemetzincin
LGYYGIGFCSGKACITSTFGLSKNENKRQLFKVAIHEMGHTSGLPHCEMKYCFMRDAGGNPTNEEKEFCTKCKSFLVNKGWNLK